MMIPPEYEPIYTAGHRAGFSEGLDASKALTLDTDNKPSLLLPLIISMILNVYFILAAWFL